MNDAININLFRLYISAIPDKAQHEPKIPWKIVRARLASKTIEQRKEREGRSGRGMSFGSNQAWL